MRRVKWSRVCLSLALSIFGPRIVLIPARNKMKRGDYRRHYTPNLTGSRKIPCDFDVYGEPIGPLEVTNWRRRIAKFQADRLVHRPEERSQCLQV
jgi:hypothetical protein